MSDVGDERRIQHLKATVTKSERAAIDHAVTLWQAMHRVTDPVNPSTRGSVLAAICSEWVAMAVDSMQPQDD